MDQFVYSKLFAWEGALAVVDSEFDGLFVSQEFPTFTIDRHMASRSICVLFANGRSCGAAFVRANRHGWPAQAGSPRVLLIDHLLPLYRPHRAVGI